jgi:hypothetical protein
VTPSDAFAAALIDLATAYSAWHRPSPRVAAWEAFYAALTAFTALAVVALYRGSLTGWAIATPCILAASWIGRNALRSWREYRAEMERHVAAVAAFDAARRRVAS